MKKLTLFLLFAFALMSNSNAQTDPCGCTTTSTKLSYTYQVPSSMCINSNGDQEFAYVVINYTLVQCGPDIGIMFSSATFIAPSCNLGYFNSSNINTAYRAAQQDVLDLYPTINGGIMDWVYPSGCISKAKVSWPPNITCYTFYPEGPKAGQVSYIYQLNDRTENLLPCDGENCCTFTYSYNVGTGRYSFISKTPDIVCTSDLLLTTDTLRCFDINGIEQTYIGTVTSHLDCESYCDPAFNLLIKTDIDKTIKTIGKENTNGILQNTKNGSNSFKPFPDPMDFKLAPTLAHDNVTFSDIKSIEKIVVYDLTGKQVMEQSVFENNNLNISKLKEGVYNVRVYFLNTGIRTIKIMKQ